MFEFAPGRDSMQFVGVVVLRLVRRPSVESVRELDQRQSAAAALRLLGWPWVQVVPELVEREEII